MHTMYACTTTGGLLVAACRRLSASSLRAKQEAPNREVGKLRYTAQAVNRRTTSQFFRLPLTTPITK